MARHSFRYLGLALVLALAGILGGWWSFDWRTRTGEDLRLHVHFEDLGGLTEGDAVYLRGARIGRVDRIDPSGRQVTVELTIRSEFRRFLSSEAVFFVWRDARTPGIKCIKVHVDRRGNDPADGLETGALLMGESSEGEILWRLGRAVAEE